MTLLPLLGLTLAPALIGAPLGLQTQLAAAAAMPSTAHQEPETVASTPPARVLLILADDLGWGEVGAYGQERIPTPNIDRIAAEGMRFTSAYSGSAVCAPSRCVMLTGQHTGHAVVRNNWEEGGWDEGADEGQYPLPVDTPNLARALKGIGAATATIGKWGLGGPESTGAPWNQGFDLFLGHLCQRKAHNFYPQHLWRNDEKLMLEGNGTWFASHQKIEAPLDTEAEYWDRFQAETYACDPMIDAAIEFLEGNAEGPLFLNYWSPIPHVALQIPPANLDAFPREWDSEHYLGQKGYVPHPRPRAAYAAMIARLDAEVGRMLDTLDAQGIADDTLVIFSSDNGPTYAGGVDHEFFESAGPWRGLKGSMYEGGIRVPFLVRWPGRVEAGSVSDHALAFEDVWATLDELFDLPGEPGSDGVSFAPTLLGDSDAQAQHEHLYWELGQARAVRRGDLKGVQTRLASDAPRFELFDLRSDPAESQDLSLERPELAAEMLSLLHSARVPSTVFPLRGVDPVRPKESEGE